jgi:hypothetical protein
MSTLPSNIARLLWGPYMVKHEVLENIYHVTVTTIDRNGGTILRNRLNAELVSSYHFGEDISNTVFIKCIFDGEILWTVTYNCPHCP